ncbi:MAG: low molecular weight protein-tyrosine-phosphatase [Nannocystaceae bacterium]
MITPRVRVLFVCYANVCRSPLAEGIFRQLATERGLAERIEIDSAGTSAMHGSTPHPRSIQIAALHGIDVSGISRQIMRDDIYTFDHIVLMDRANHRALTRLATPSAFAPEQTPRARIRLLLQIANPRVKAHALDVPDPINGGPTAYPHCFELIQQGCQALLEELTSNACGGPSLLD